MTITFTDFVTPVPATWLNDVNTVAYTTVPANTSAIAVETAARIAADALKAPITSAVLVTPNIGVAAGTSLGLTSTLSATQVTSTIATGTPPLVVTSTTEVANLKAATATLATTATNLSGGTVAASTVTATASVLAGNSSLLGYSDSTNFPAGAWDISQITSKTTAVTLNKPFGQITTSNAALAAGAVATFVLNNNLLSARDVLVLGITSAGGVGRYSCWSIGGSGAAYISIKNETAGSLSESVYINFCVLRCGIIAV